MPYLTEEQSDIMLAALYLFILLCQKTITACIGTNPAKAEMLEHQMAVATATHALLLDFLLG